MQQHWNIRSRAHHCALTERPFEDGEAHYTAIYFDTKSGEFTRRDVAADAWAQEIAERTPFSHWKAVYHRTVPDAKPEVVPKESAMALLQRLVDENESYTENARYILAAMLERKRILSPTATKENDEGHKLLFYENKKTGDVFIIRDPELRLDEVASVQEEVATLLGFGAATPPPPKKPEPVAEQKDQPDPPDASVQSDQTGPSEHPHAEEAPEPPSGEEEQEEDPDQDLGEEEEEYEEEDIEVIDEDEDDSEEDESAKASEEPSQSQ
jgi:hypothetical protein